jgi:hypothetical protein
MRQSRQNLLEEGQAKPNSSCMPLVSPQIEEIVPCTVSSIKIRPPFKKRNAAYRFAVELSSQTVKKPDS